MKNNFQEKFLKYIIDYFHVDSRKLFVENVEDFLTYMYVNEFQRIPIIKKFFNKHNIIYNTFDIWTHNKSEVNQYLNLKHNFCDIKFDYTTIKNFINKANELGYEYFWWMENLIVFIDNDNNIILCEQNVFYSFAFEIKLYVVNKDGILPQWAVDSIEYIQPKENIKFDYMSVDKYGNFIANEMTVQNFKDLDISANYNDDFPHEQILNALKMDKAGIITLHGEPGTGKTTYIRHLMAIMPEKKFIVMDQNMLANINNCEFIVTMYKHKGSIIIIEDCEPLLRTRKDGNCGMSTLLNLTDGLLADTFGIKFICTYNADSTILDEALMRDGRMLFDYEFKKLSNDKAIKLCQNLNLSYTPTGDEPLSKIYNASIKNMISEKKCKKKIGF